MRAPVRIGRVWFRALHVVRIHRANFRCLVPCMGFSAWPSGCKKGPLSQAEGNAEIERSSRAGAFLHFSSPLSFSSDRALCSRPRQAAAVLDQQPPLPLSSPAVLRRRHPRPSVASLVDQAPLSSSTNSRCCPHQAPPSSAAAVLDQASPPSSSRRTPDLAASRRHTLDPAVWSRCASDLVVPCCCIIECVMIQFKYAR